MCRVKYNASCLVKSLFTYIRTFCYKAPSLSPNECWCYETQTRVQWSVKLAVETRLLRPQRCVEWLNGDTQLHEHEGGVRGHPPNPSCHLGHGKETAMSKHTYIQNIVCLFTS